MKLSDLPPGVSVMDEHINPSDERKAVSAPLGIGVERYAEIRSELERIPIGNRDPSDVTIGELLDEIDRLKAGMGQIGCLGCFLTFPNTDDGKAELVDHVETCGNHPFKKAHKVLALMVRNLIESELIAPALKCVKELDDIIGDFVMPTEESK